MIECLLCTLDLYKEKVFYEDGNFIILRTSKLKGHKERIMIVSREHKHDISPAEFEFAISKLEEIGCKVFNYTPKFVIMDSTFATIKEHWHLVATDLDPKSEDFEQILDTAWVKVIDRRFVERDW